MIAALVAWVRPALQYGLIAYMSGRLLWKAVTHSAEPFSEMEALLIKGAVALYIAANAAAYTGYVRDLLLYGLPSEINQAIAGATGGQPITAAIFDDVWNKAWVSGLAVYRNLSWTQIGLQFLVVVYWVVALLAVAAGFLIWLKAFVFLALLIATGPIFIGLFLFPALRGVTRGWLGSVLSNVILQIFSVALLVILLAAETELVARIARPGSANEIVQIQMLLGGMLLFVVCGWLALQLPGLAATIGGGFSADAGFLGHFFGQPHHPQPDRSPPDRQPQQQPPRQPGPQRNTPPGRSIA
jgi:type IV secretion system protein VirB6